MTRGIQPYGGVQNWDILHYIKCGNRLPQCETCPDILYEIMSSCWDIDPHNRPTFTELVNDLQNAIMTLQAQNDQLDLYVSTNVHYVNVAPPLGYYNQTSDTDPSSSPLSPLSTNV